MAKLGHEVVAVDVDPVKIERLAAGDAPFFEPGLPEILAEAIGSGRIRFTTDMAEVAGARVHFLAVGTPQGPTGAADLKYVDAAVAALTEHVSAGEFIVGKSTVPVGTAARLAGEVAERVPGATLVWNPEFLREGFAVQDTISPDRLVYGVPAGSEGEAAVAVLDEVYATTLAEGTPRLVVDLATAELVKVSANAFLATKISFINAMAEIAEVVGADVTALADVIGHDARIGRKFLNAGLGFGGGCLPKDIRAFQARASELGVGESLEFLADVDAINLRRRAHVVTLAQELLGGDVAGDGGDVAGKRVAVLGLAFKPNSDDVRDSPALDIAARLLELGATVAAYDPEANGTAARIHPEIAYVDSAAAALQDADLVLVLTEWTEFRELDPAAVAALVASPVVVDGRNCLDRDAWTAAGFTYRGMGR